MATKPSIVFAHGLWADGSCFSKLIPTLQAEGHEVIAAQNSLDSLKGDVEAVHRALGRVSSPVILVGHSYGGTIITAAGTDERVVGLVYICALAPDADETSQSLAGQISANRRLRPHRSRRWSRVAEAEWHCVLRRRFARDRNRNSFGRPKACQPRTSSTRNSKEPRGDRSRAGTSWARTTALSTLIWNALWQSGWAPPPLRSTVAMYLCSRSLMLCSMLSVPRRARYRNAAARESTVACPALDQ